MAASEHHREEEAAQTDCNWVLENKSILKAQIATRNQEMSSYSAGRIVHSRQTTHPGAWASVTRLYFSFILQSVVKKKHKTLIFFCK